MRCLLLLSAIVVAINARSLPQYSYNPYPHVSNQQHTNTHGGITHIHQQHPVQYPVYHTVVRPHHPVLIQPAGKVTNSQVTNAHHGSQAHNSQLTNVRRPGANVHNSQLTNSVHGAHVTNAQVTNLHNTLGHVSNSQVTNH